MASTNLSADIPRDLYKAWTSKFEQSYQQAKVMLKDTTDFDTIQEIYDEIHKKIRKENFAQDAIKAKNTILKASETISKIMTVILTNAGIFAGMFFLIWSIIIDHAHGNSSMHELIGVILLIASSSILLRRTAHQYEYLITVLSGGRICIFKQISK